MKLLKRALATFYITQVVVDIATTYINKEELRPFNFKPLNCSLCMSFWSALPVLLLPDTVLNAPAVAGVALLLSKIKERLETWTI